MKKLILFAALTVSVTCAFAENKSLDLNPANCAKVKGWSSKFEEGVSAAIGVATYDIEFRRTQFGVTCDYVVSTPKGMYLCAIPLIIDPSEKGKKIFAGGYYGPTDCRKTTVVN